MHQGMSMSRHEAHQGSLLEVGRETPGKDSQATATAWVLFPNQVVAILSHYLCMAGPFSMNPWWVPDV